MSCAGCRANPVPFKLGLAKCPQCGESFCWACREAPKPTPDEAGAQPALGLVSCSGHEPVVDSIF